MLLLSCSRLWLHIHTLSTPIRVTGTNSENIFSIKWHKMAAVMPQVGAGFLDAKQEVLFFLFVFFLFVFWQKEGVGG